MALELRRRHLVDFRMILAVLAVALAAAAGFLLSGCMLGFARRRKLAGAVRASGESRLEKALPSGLPGLVLRYAANSCLRSVSVRGGGASGYEERDRGLARRIETSGLSDVLAPAGFRRARLELAALCAVAGFALGVFLSAALAFLLAALGALAGWRAPTWALGMLVDRRVEEVERHLPEMLDVVSLGLRSGLSFEGALGSYCRHFDTLLSRELGAAKSQWGSGLVSRDEALASVSASFDSPVLARVMGDIARSLRYGSALSGSLEAVAVEVRKDYRARKQEEIAKAPVKMMLPTGALILPAMLILVLGPVMLELMAGF